MYDPTDTGKVSTLQQFLAATQNYRTPLPFKDQIDAAIKHYNITSEDLIADIYAYFLY